MTNQYITDTILAQQAGENVRLSDADFKEITDRDRHVVVTITDRQRQLEAVVAMEEWYKKNERASSKLEDTTQHHSLVNKQYLALRSDELRLERFDSVLPLQSQYEQIAERRRVIEGIMEQESELANSIADAREKTADAERRRDVAIERLADAKEQFVQNQSAIENGYIMEGEIKTLVEELRDCEERLVDAQQKMGERETDFRSRQMEMQQSNQQLETLGTHHQALAVHQQLFEQYQAVKDKLQLYNSEAHVNEDAHQQFTHNNHRHSDLLLLHEKAKKALQSKSEKRDALVADKKVHKAAIQELDSSSLHRQYSIDQQRLAQLQSAQSAWQILTAGYENIETQRSLLERMARSLDQKQQEHEVVERDVRRLYERYNRLNKAFILLQIENTRKMREGLKEGTPCPVCGSAHHPYNTEVEQELGETQSQQEKDFLASQREYEERKVAAAEVSAEAKTFAGQLNAERAVLERMLTEQHVLEDSWSQYQCLDSTFTICSPSVNRDARRTTIEMLIDSTKRRIEDMEQRMVRLDFHTEQLKKVSIEAQHAETEVQAAQTEFWKIDTELQLVHERLEHFRILMSESDARIEHLYKDLDDVVTLSGWRDENLEVFSKNLSELYNDWNLTTRNLDRCQHEHDILQYRLSVAADACQHARQHVDSCREERDRVREVLNSKREQLRKNFGTNTPSEHFALLIQGVSVARQNCEKAIAEHNDLHEHLAALFGQRTTLQDTRTRQEEHLREVSTTLDHAIARYNLTHSAIQASELADLFGDTRDWGLLRHTISECRDALLKATEQMSMAERHFLDLQKAPERPSKDNPNDTPEMLSQRHTALVLELEALRGEQADIRRIIDRHRKNS